VDLKQGGVALLGPVGFIAIFYRTLRASSGLLEQAPTAALREREHKMLPVSEVLKDFVIK
jgi:hypothetical protein